MRVVVVLAAVLAIGGCKKAREAPPPVTSPAELDALWKLAPDGAALGVVVSSAAIARLESGFLTVIDMLKRSPEFAAKLDEELKKGWGAHELSLAAVGLTSRKPMAVFAIDIEKPIVILPLADRDKWIVATHGKKGAESDVIDDGFTCKTVKGVYACTQDTSLFERLGTGDMSAKRSAISGRGDIEWAGTVPGTPLSQAGNIQLGRGSFVIRAVTKGWPAQLIDFFTNAKPRTSGNETAGFMVLAGGSYLTQLRARMPPLEVGHGVTLDALVKSIEGPFTLTIRNAALTFDLRVELADPTPVQQLLDHCDELRFAKADNGACHMSLPGTLLNLDAWIDGKTLHIAQKAPETETIAQAPLSSIATELANREWIFALLARGSVLSTAGIRFPLPARASIEDTVAVRLLSTVNEVGVGLRRDGDAVHVMASVRTVWSNPADVVEEVLAIDPRDVVSGKAADRAQAIANAHPASQFADDFKSGASGLSIPTLMVAAIQTMVSRTLQEPAQPAE